MESGVPKVKCIKIFLIGVSLDGKTPHAGYGFSPLEGFVTIVSRSKGVTCFFFGVWAIKLKLRQRNKIEKNTLMIKSVNYHPKVTTAINTSIQTNNKQNNFIINTQHQIPSPDAQMPMKKIDNSTNCSLSIAKGIYT